MDQTQNTRQQQAEQTKDKLFYAAEELLAERDYDDITIRDIVARAQVSIGTFYHYYTTKIDVFYNTFRLADHYFYEVVAPQLNQPTSAERILGFFDAYAHYSCDKTSPRMTRLLYNPENHFFNRDTPDGMMDVLRTLLQDGMDRGELAADEAAENAAETLMICARGQVYHWCTCDGCYDLPAEMKHFMARMLRAYRPGAAPAAGEKE